MVRSVAERSSFNFRRVCLLAGLRDSGLLKPVGVPPCYGIAESSTYDFGLGFQRTYLYRVVVEILKYLRINWLGPGLPNAAPSNFRRVCLLAGTRFGSAQTRRGTPLLWYSGINHLRFKYRIPKDLFVPRGGRKNKVYKNQFVTLILRIRLDGCGCWGCSSFQFSLCAMSGMLPVYSVRHPPGLYRSVPHPPPP